MDVGDHRLGRLAAEARARPGRQRLQLGDHLGHVLNVDAANPAQTRQVPLGQQIQIIEQTAHGRIEPVALDQLQFQAFRHRPRHDARRFKPVADRQYALDPFERHAQPVGDLGQFAAQIAALVDAIDQGQGDGVVGGREGRLRGLGLQMLPQGHLAAVGLFAALAVGQSAARAGAGPVVQPDLGLADADVLHPVRGALAGAGVAIDIVRTGVERAVRIRHPALVEAHLGGVMALHDRRGVDLAAGLGVLALQQGVLLQLGLDESLQLKVRQLQQLDRLLQLGRDDQTLALPYLQPLSEQRSFSPASGRGPKLAAATLWPDRLTAF